MQPNYDEQYKRQQQDYQRSRNPFEYGQQVAQRRYSEIMANLDAQRMGTQQTYGDMYQAARQRAIGSQAMGGPTLSGGMGQQRRDFIGALEMQEMGKIQQAGLKADADLYAQGQAAFSNAQLEGQQATQMELQNRQAQLSLVQQKQAIMNDSNLSAEQKEQQLNALEGGTNSEYVAQKQTGVDQILVTAGVGVGAVGAAGAGIIKTASIVKGASALATVAAGTGKTAAAVAASGAGKSLILGSLGLGKIGTAAAVSMAAHPIGWAIGALAVGLIIGGLIYSAVK
jgi:hypothetical protein